MAEPKPAAAAPTDAKPAAKPNMLRIWNMSKKNQQESAKVGKGKKVTSAQLRVSKGKMKPITSC